MREVFMRYFIPILLSIVLIHPQQAMALERISSVVFNTGKVHPFFMTSGRRTLIQSYCPVKAAPSGSEVDVKTEIASYDATQVWISLVRPLAQGTNIFVICPHEPPMVLEVVPSKDTHQDVLKIVTAFGSAELQGIPLVEVDSNQKRTEEGKSK
jgi:hypothetical protein